LPPFSPTSFFGLKTSFGPRTIFFFFSRPPSFLVVFEHSTFLFQPSFLSFHLSLTVRAPRSAFSFRFCKPPLTTFSAGVLNKKSGVPHKRFPTPPFLSPFLRTHTLFYTACIPFPHLVCFAPPVPFVIFFCAQNIVVSD